jgi:transposase-like protein
VIKWIKQFFCKHDYKWTGNSIRCGNVKGAGLFAHYKCTKCGKTIERKESI